MKRSNQEHQFKENVYRIVASIPRGKVLSYQQVAEIVGSPHAYRAVGNILNKHQIKGLPCHRVVRANGEVGGYRWGKKKKIRLLKKEGVKINAKGKIIFER